MTNGKKNGTISKSKARRSRDFRPRLTAGRPAENAPPRRFDGQALQNRKREGITLHKLKELLRSAQVIEFLKYCVVGGIAFIADTASLMLFYHFVFGEFSFDLLFLHIADGRTAAATAVGFLVGLVVNYVLSVLFVFNRPGQQEKGKSVGAFLIFGVVGLIGLALTELGMMLGVGLLGDKFLLPVKIVVAGIVMVWNYLGRKIFVYGGKNAGNGKKGEEKE